MTPLVIIVICLSFAYLGYVCISWIRNRHVTIDFIIGPVINKDKKYDANINR
jgi:hypothetical protein